MTEESRKSLTEIHVSKFGNVPREKVSHFLNILFHSRIIHRLKLLVQNIGSGTKHGKENLGNERKRYILEKKTATVFQGSDTPKELYGHTAMMIKERFSRIKNNGSHLQVRLDNIYRNLCISFTAYCIDT